ESSVEPLICRHLGPVPLSTPQFNSVSRINLAFGSTPLLSPARPTASASTQYTPHGERRDGGEAPVVAALWPTKRTCANEKIEPLARMLRHRRRTRRTRRWR